MISPYRRPNRHIRWISAANASDNPIRFREIETRVKAQCHYRCSSLGRSNSGDHAQDAVPVQTHAMITGRQRKNLVEMLAFHPELKFAGGIAGILATLEHGNHDNFDPNRSRRRRDLGEKTGRITRIHRERDDEPLRKATHEVSACCAMSEDL